MRIAARRVDPLFSCEGVGSSRDVGSSICGSVVGDGFGLIFGAVFSPKPLPEESDDHDERLCRAMGVRCGGMNAKVFRWL